MWSNPKSSLDDRAERRTWEKQILMCLFHLFCLSSQALVSTSHSKTHTSSIGNLCPFAQLLSTNMEPNPQGKHKGLPCVFRRSLRPLVLSHFLSFVRYRRIFQCPPTHPLSSGRRRASLGFEHMRHHQWRSHPTHQQWESYSRKGRVLVQDVNRQKQKGLIWEMVLHTQIKTRPCWYYQFWGIFCHSV